MNRKIGIAGAGITGRLLAWRLANTGAKVTLFEQHALADRSSTSYAAAGMLAPVSEAARGEPAIFALGKDSLQRWQEIVRDLQCAETLTVRGTLALAYEQDLADLFEFTERVRQKCGHESVQVLSSSELTTFEPGLSDSPVTAAFIGCEGQIDNHRVLDALAFGLYARGATVIDKTTVTAVAPGAISYEGTVSGTAEFDLAIDCRGVGSRSALHNLRGVRGEIIEVQARGLTLSRPVRLMHQRYPVYLVPRGSGIVIGATCIESENDGPITVQSMLELLSGCYNLHPEVKNSSITTSRTGLRPAFDDNQPRILHQPGLMFINGLFRHGYLLSPVVTAAAAGFIMDGATDEANVLFQEISH